MKYLQRYLSLLFALVMSLGLFSVGVSADEVDTTNYKVNISAWDGYGSFGQINVEEGGTDSFYEEKSLSASVIEGGYLWYQQYIFATTDGSVMFEANEKYKFSARNFYMRAQFLNDYGFFQDGYYQDFLYYLYNAELIYSNGTRESIDDLVTYTFNPATNTFDYVIEFTPAADVYKLVISDCMVAYAPVSGTTDAYWSYIQYSIGTNGLDISLDKQSEEAGLLSGILGWVENIWNKLGDIVDSITELPGKIWEYIENGLKSLFVPDEDYLADFQSRWDELLADRFGMVYEAVHLLYEGWDAVFNSEQQDIITIEAVSIDLPDGAVFSFGPYEVDIVPYGFEFLQTACKSAVGIICVLLYINGLRRRYDEVFR